VDFLPLFVTVMHFSLNFTFSAERKNLQVWIEPLGDDITSTSLTALSPNCSEELPVIGCIVPSAGPLQEAFQTLPSASINSSLNVIHFDVSTRVTKTSLVTGGLPPKSVSARLSFHVLGVGR